jgi:hypothetical protein
VFAAGLGLLAVPTAGGWFGDVLGVDAAEVSVADLLLGGALAVAAFAATVLVARGRPSVVAAVERSPLGSWAGLGALLSPRPALAVARALAAVDDRVIDRAVLGVARAVVGLAVVTSRADSGLVDGAVRATARGFRRAGSAARRPQTGLLHQYYVQATAGLGVLLVLLLAVR